MRHRVRIWLRDHPSLAFGISALLLSVGSGFVLANLIAAAVLIVIAGLVGAFGVRLRESQEVSRKELEAQIVRATDEITLASRAIEAAFVAVEDATENWVQALGVSAQLGSDARVSLYHLNGNGWRRRARFSRNLMFMESGRATLPIGQGMVHQAHLTGEHVVDDLPSFEDDPDGYYSEHKKLGINKGICKDFTMRSRSYACFAFGRDGYKGRPYAIVFESTDPKGLDSDALQGLLHTESKRVVSDLVVLADLLHR